MFLIIDLFLINPLVLYFQKHLIQNFYIWNYGLLRPLKIEDKINIALVINQSITYRKWHAIQFSQPRDQIFVKGYGFLSFTENVGRNIVKNIIKHSQKRLDHARRSATDTLKTASKRAIQKTAEGTGDLIGNKIADKSESQTFHSRIIQEQIKKKYFGIYISKTKTL